jgi:hypothetical protein
LLVNRTPSLVPRVPTHARAALVVRLLDEPGVTGRAVVVLVVVVAIIPIDRRRSDDDDVEDDDEEATRARSSIYERRMRETWMGLEDVCVCTRGS